MSENVNRPLIIGHRGALDEAPEHTLKGFKRAIELNPDFIEFDVHETRDGELIVIHGDDILRRMGIERKISQMTLKEVKKIKLEEGEKIPELNEVIELAKGKLNLLCEIKTKGISGKLLDLLRTQRVLDSTIIQSFHIEVLLSLRKADNNIKLGWIVPITEEYIPEWEKRRELVQRVIDSKFPYIVTRFKNIDAEFVKFAHKHRLQVFAYTLNTKKTMRKMIDLGVDGIIVNSITKAKEVLKQLSHE